MGLDNIVWFCSFDLNYTLNILYTSYSAIRGNVCKSQFSSSTGASGCITLTEKVKNLFNEGACLFSIIIIIYFCRAWVTFLYSQQDICYLPRRPLPPWGQRTHITVLPYIYILNGVGLYTSCGWFDGVQIDDYFLYMMSVCLLSSSFRGSFLYYCFGGSCSNSVFHKRH